MVENTTLACINIPSDTNFYLICLLPSLSATPNCFLLVPFLTPTCASVVSLFSYILPKNSLSPTSCDKTEHDRKHKLFVVHKQEEIETLQSWEKFQ